MRPDGIRYVFDEDGAPLPPRWVCACGDDTQEPDGWVCWYEDGHTYVACPRDKCWARSRPHLKRAREAQKELRWDGNEPKK